MMLWCHFAQITKHVFPLIHSILYIYAHTFLQISALNAIQWGLMASHLSWSKHWAFLVDYLNAEDVQRDIYVCDCLWNPYVNRKQVNDKMKEYTSAQSQFQSPKQYVLLLQFSVDKNNSQIPEMLESIWVSVRWVGEKRRRQYPEIVPSHSFVTQPLINP